MALDHLRLRLPVGVDAVKRVEHEIGGVPRRPRTGDDRIQYRKIRDPDKDAGFRPIRSPEAGRNANRKRRGRGSFKQIASSHSGFSPRLQTEGPISPNSVAQMRRARHAVLSVSNTSAGT